MKILKIFKKESIEEYRVGERSETTPQEFIKEIQYKDGNFTVFFSDDKEWFKSFINMPCEYQEFGESKLRSNKDKFINK